MILTVRNNFSHLENQKVIIKLENTLVFLV